MSSAFNFFTSITGTSFTTMSVFALGISPYITSSIIIQLLTIAIPKLEELHKEGTEGRKKLTQITRVLTVALAVIQSMAMAIGFGDNYLTNYTWYNVILVAVIMTAGSTVLMWFGEQITLRGVGNGISIILVINILDTLPDDLMTLYTHFVAGQSIAPGRGDHPGDSGPALCPGAVRGVPAGRRAPDSGAVRQKNGGKKDGGRPVLPHSH